MLAAMGLVLGSLSLLMAHHGGDIGIAVSGALYLFSGAIYPLDVLPAWLRPVGFAMPLTYWLELIRRALVGDVAQAFPTLVNYSNVDLMGILFGLILAFSILAYFTFRYCDYKARELGYIDMTTNY